MDKPIKKYPYEPMFDWHEIEGYINRKYDRELRDWGNSYVNNPNNEKRPYQDFWHYICDTCEPHNGGVFWLTGIDDDMEDWQIEIMNILRSEGFLDDNYLGQFFADW